MQPTGGAWAAGPCPECLGEGALVIRRRGVDGRLLFHCPRCGLAFTHVPEDVEPEYAKSLDAIAPDGSRFATEQEIREAGLSDHARPWTPPAPPPPTPEPARVHVFPRAQPATKPVVLKPSKPKSSGAAKAIGGGISIFVILKLIALLSHLFRDK